MNRRYVFLFCLSIFAVANPMDFNRESNTRKSARLARVQSSISSLPVVEPDWLEECGDECCKIPVGSPDDPCGNCFCCPPLYVGSLVGSGVAAGGVAGLYGLLHCFINPRTDYLACVDADTSTIMPLVQATSFLAITSFACIAKLHSHRQKEKRLKMT